jgi:hypothetical protein
VPWHSRIVDPVTGRITVGAQTGQFGAWFEDTIIEPGMWLPNTKGTLQPGETRVLTPGMPLGCSVHFDPCTPALGGPGNIVAIVVASTPHKQDLQHVRMEVRGQANYLSMVPALIPGRTARDTAFAGDCVYACVWSPNGQLNGGHGGKRYVVVGNAGKRALVVSVAVYCVGQADSQYRLPGWREGETEMFAALCAKEQGQ